MCEVLKKWHDSGFEKGMTAGVQQGISQGISQGIQKGERKNAIESSKKLLEMKILTLAQISEVTGLAVEELKELEKDL